MPRSTIAHAAKTIMIAIAAMHPSSISLGCGTYRGYLAPEDTVMEEHSVALLIAPEFLHAVTPAGATHDPRLLAATLPLPSLSSGRLLPCL